MAALKIIGSGEFPRSRLTGSWAGAMGQTQFIPTSFLSTAVDGDGDGKRDVWGSAPDALASAANLLAKGGWVRGQGWAREVIVPEGFDYSVTEGPSLKPDAWANLGVRRADGLPGTDADAGADTVLIAPTGAAGPLFLLFPNHFVIRKYNNATTYALAVGLLADRFAGAGPLVRPWPYETPLSLPDRIAAQQALIALGFEPGLPDGVVGVNTRSALRAWQKSPRLVADGYLSMGMVRPPEGRGPDGGRHARAAAADRLALVALFQGGDGGVGAGGGHRVGVLELRVAERIGQHAEHQAHVQDEGRPGDLLVEQHEQRGEHHIDPVDRGDGARPPGPVLPRPRPGTNRR